MVQESRSVVQGASKEAAPALAFVPESEVCAVASQLGHHLKPGNLCHSKEGQACTRFARGLGCGDTWRSMVLLAPPIEQGAVASSHDSGALERRVEIGTGPSQTCPGGVSVRLQRLLAQMKQSGSEGCPRDPFPTLAWSTLQDIDPMGFNVGP